MTYDETTAANIELVVIEQDENHPAGQGRN